MKCRYRIPLVALAGLLLSGAHASAQEYDLHIIEALSDFGIPESYLGAVNNHGLAAGTMTYTTQDADGNYHTTYHGYLWSADGGPVVDPDPSGYSDVNDNGDLLAGGTIRFADGRVGHMTPVPGDLAVGGTAINEAGMVVGTSTYRYYSGCRYSRRAVIWTEATGTVNLADFVPYAHVGRDINNANEVVGNASYSGSCGDFEAFLYRVDSGEWVDLHAMLSQDPAADFNGDGAINTLDVLAFLNAWNTGC